MLKVNCLRTSRRPQKGDVTTIAIGVPTNLHWHNFVEEVSLNLQPIVPVHRSIGVTTLKSFLEPGRRWHALERRKLNASSAGRCTVKPGEKMARAAKSLAWLPSCDPWLFIRIVRMLSIRKPNYKNDYSSMFLSGRMSMQVCWDTNGYSSHISFLRSPTSSQTVHLQHLQIFI
jgi:hypothetical protein